MADAFKLVLDCVKTIPEFDGTDSSQLPEFINSIETLMVMYNALQDQFKPIIFRVIKNKCIGKTREAINCAQEEINTWVSLKNLLKQKFGEKCTVIELMDQLKTLQLKGTIEGFYNRITKLVVKVNNRRITHEENDFRLEEIQRAALSVFKHHLPEPSKTMIFSRNPSDLDAAYKIILEARHQNYTQDGPPQNNNNSNNRNAPGNRKINNYNNQNNDYNRNQYNNNRNNNNNARNHYNNQNNNNYNNNNNRNNNNNNNVNNLNNSMRNNNNNGYNNNNQNNNFNRMNQGYNNSGNFRGHNNSGNYRGPNNNNNYNNNNNHNNNNNNSGNYRRNEMNQEPNTSAQTRRSNRPEPMEIGQINSNFQQATLGNFLT